MSEHETNKIINGKPATVIIDADKISVKAGNTTIGFKADLTPHHITTVNDYGVETRLEIQQLQGTHDSANIMLGGKHSLGVYHLSEPPYARQLADALEAVASLPAAELPTVSQDKLAKQNLSAGKGKQHG